MSLMVVAAIFLRWMPHHGVFVSTLVLTAVITACGINFTHTSRFMRAVHGINRDSVAPNTASTAMVAASVGILSLAGIYTVLFLG